MKIYFNSKIASLLPDGLEYITLWPFGVFCKGNRISLKYINHEAIHWEQQKELFGIFFYILYLYYWIKEVVIMASGGDKKCYKDIKFEKEAHDNDENQDYLSERKKFAWKNY